eukprot:scaffold87586_cov32-Tisochrysis_lutea.AAC.7
MRWPNRARARSARGRQQSRHAAPRHAARRWLEQGARLVRASAHLALPGAEGRAEATGPICARRLAAQRRDLRRTPPRQIHPHTRASAPAPASTPAPPAERWAPRRDFRINSAKPRPSCPPLWRRCAASARRTCGAKTGAERRRASRKCRTSLSRPFSISGSSALGCPSGRTARRASNALRTTTRASEPPAESLEPRADAAVGSGRHARDIHDWRSSSALRTKEREAGLATCLDGFSETSLSSMSSAALEAARSRSRARRAMRRKYAPNSPAV